MQKHEKKQKLKTIAWRKKYEINQVDDIEKILIIMKINRLILN